MHTDTLSECLVPNCGISMEASLRSTISCCTPCTSLPNTSAYFSPGAVLKSLSETEFSDYFVSFGLQVCNRIFRVLKVFPVYGKLRAKGGLVDFGGWGSGADSAEDYFLRDEGVAGTEYGADIELASDIVQNYCYWQLLPLPELFNGVSA